MRTNLAQIIARKLNAVENCVKSENWEWYEKHMNQINYLVREFMPSGSGIDTGTKFVWEKSSPEKLVFQCSFHHMNVHGMYVYWTEHTITVKGSLVWGLDIKVSGRNRNSIKDHLYQCYSDALDQDASE